MHLTVPPGRRGRHRADRRIHCSVVPPSRIRRCAPASASPLLERTWLDLAAPAAAGGVARGGRPGAARGGVRRRRSWSRSSAEAGGATGRADGRRVLPLADARAGSPMESVLRWLLHEAGLPGPVLQHVVADGAAGKVGKVDLAWPEQRVLVEFDGDVHRDRRVFVDDLRRQNGLVMAGWTVLRFSSADCWGGRSGWSRPSAGPLADLRRATNSWPIAAGWPRPIVGGRGGAGRGGR